MAAVRFPSTCVVCTARIPVGSGDVRRGSAGWVTTCDAHRPQRMTPNPRTPQGFDNGDRRVRMTDGEVVIMVLPDNVHDAMQDGFRRA